MTAAELKASILDQAIRGKLVPQDPGDEPAAELLKRIKAEKAKLIAAKKIKKEKPLAPITDDEKPFDLSKGWEWVRWGDISTSIQYGYNAPAKSSGKVRFVRISDIQNGRVMWETVPFCDIKDDEIDDYLLKPNDILFARTGGTVGKSYIVRDVPEIAIYAGYLIRTRCGSELEPMFFKYFMESDLYWSQLRSGTIATAQPNCNGQTLANMKLPLPPLAEQKRIVEKIEELMPLVERYGKAEERRAKLNAALPADLEKSILQEAIQGRLTTGWREEAAKKVEEIESAAELLKRIKAEKAKLIAAKKIKKEKPLAPITDDEKPFDLPDGWEWCRLGELVRAISGVSYQKDDVLNSGPVRIFRGGNVKEDASVIAKDDDVFLPITYKDDDNSLQLNDVIIVASTGSSAVIGRPGLVKELYPNTQIGAFLKIIRTYKEGYAPFIHLIFKSEYYRENIRQAVKGIGIKNLKGEYISNMPIPLPPLAEQKAIVAKVEELLAQVRSLRTK